MIPNLDAMPPEELRDARSRYERLARLYPKAAPVARILREYCGSKHAAILERTQGRILVALNYEAACDRAYDELAKLAPGAVW